MAMERKSISKLVKGTTGIFILGGIAWGIGGAWLIEKRISDFNDGLYAAQARYIEVEANIRAVEFNEAIARREGVSATQLTNSIEESMLEAADCKYSAKGELNLANKARPEPLKITSYFDAYGNSMVKLIVLQQNLTNASKLVVCANNIYAGVRVNVRLYREWVAVKNKLNQNLGVYKERRKSIESLLELGLSDLNEMDFKTGKRHISAASNELKEVEEMIFLLDEGRAIREVVAEKRGSLKTRFYIDQHFSELESAVAKGDAYSALEQIDSIKKLAVSVLPGLESSYKAHLFGRGEWVEPVPAG
jgi:hypothetical protein